MHGDGKLLLGLLSLLLVLTAGCAVISPTDAYAPPPGVKDGWFVTPTPTPQARLAPQDINGSLSLEECLKIALTNNPEVAATTWDVGTAGARLDQAKAARWPSLSYEASYTKFLDSQRLIQARYNNERGVFSKQISRGEVVMKLPLFTGGRIISEIKAADLIFQSENNRLSRTRQELIFNVSSTFYNLLGQEKVIDSIKFNIQAMEEQRKQIALMLEVAKAAKVDLLRIEVRLADLNQNLVREVNAQAILMRVLANLLGLDYVEEPLRVQGKLSFEEISLKLEQLVQTALAQRPDYLSARKRLESQAKRVDAAKAGHWPNVSLAGAYGYRGTGFNDILDDRSIPGESRGPVYDDAGQIAVVAALPLFEGGRIQAKVREEYNALAAAQERLRRLDLQVRQDVETAVLEVNSSSERVRATEKAIEQARESLRIERLKYDLGAGSITNVLDAQAALLQSETNYYRALADFRIALARLNLATGGELS